MISQILNSLGGLAKSYIDAKTTVKITEAEIKKKQLTGEIDWEQSAIEASKDRQKDELCKSVFVLILAANLVSSLQDAMTRGFANLKTLPLWVQWRMYASFTASFGIRTMKGLTKCNTTSTMYQQHRCLSGDQGESGTDGCWCGWTDRRADELVQSKRKFTSSGANYFHTGGV